MSARLHVCGTQTLAGSPSDTEKGCSREEFLPEPGHLECFMNKPKPLPDAAMGEPWHCLASVLQPGQKG